LRDIEVIMMELIFAEIASAEKRLERVQKTNKLGKDKEAAAEAVLLQRLLPHLNSGKPALSLEVNDDEAKLMKGFFLLSSKPTLYACNVKEEDLGGLENNNRSTPTGQRVKQVEDYAKNHLASQAVVISAKIEEDLMDLSPEEQKEYLQGLGVQESGVGQLIKKTYSLLGLETYLTTGEKETRAWTIHKGFTAPQAAGVIHGDFERGFIAAECMAYDDIVKHGTITKVREAGRLRMEGKNYIVQDGDVMEFRFNVSK
jgi:ribosome-binding ATPase